VSIAVVTSFPNDNWNVSAAEMLATFKAYWPEDIKMYIQLDEQPEDTFMKLNNDIVSIMGEDRVFIAGLWDEDQKAFRERWKDNKPENYLFDVVKFSNKVFALEKCADALKDSVDYLIWLDSDVITKRQVTYEWLKTVLPDYYTQACSYLGRDGWYSECGWVAYNLKANGYDLLARMKDCYVTDAFKNDPNWQNVRGWTDCHVFDFYRAAYESKNLSTHYIKDTSDIDVWPQTKLAECLVHRKGNRKHVAAKNRQKQGELTKKSSEKVNVIDAEQINIKTRNCLDHDKICANIRENMSQIRSWATITSSTDDDIVICSAGPSLADHIEEIRERQKNGAKVIAVKHAIDTLKLHNIKPWAVVLLDPRAHVEGFVKAPDPDVVYFVASMCDPSVVSTLNENRCKVIGYHALVNAGELKLMVSADLPVSGGSATATRAIGLFSDMFGYKNFHLYGYDLCYHLKPDMTKVNDQGQQQYMEINIGAHSYGNKYVTRTFWTEGQFLAQSNELKNLYKDRKDLNIAIYGDGMAGWLYKHHLALKKYQAEYRERLDQKRQFTPNLQEYVNAVTTGSDLSRGV
jgi:hypothetical protein